MPVDIELNEHRVTTGRTKDALLDRMRKIMPDPDMVFWHS
jgi:hypothetical protein